MNKEEFKLSVTQQFRDVHSPIRKLMLANLSIDLNSDGEDMYSAETCFYASDFGLSFVVEYVEHNANAPHGPIFQLQFADLPPKFTIDPDFIHLDFCDPTFKARKWGIEEVRFTKEGLELWINLCGLEEKDYYYRYAYMNAEKIAVYDVVSGEFSPDDSPWDLKLPLRLHKKVVTDYIRYIFSSSDRLKLLDILKRKKVKSPMRENILNAFNGLSLGEKESTLTQLVDTLHILRHDEVYTP